LRSGVDRTEGDASPFGDLFTHDEPALAAEQLRHFGARLRGAHRAEGIATDALDVQRGRPVETKAAVRKDARVDFDAGA
jgi:hypothetical protein